MSIACRQIRRFLLGVFAASLFAGGLVADEPAPPADKGTLDEVAEKTAELLKFRWNSGRLELDWNKKHNEVTQKLMQISSAAGGSSSGSSSSSGSYRYSRSFRRDKLDGEIHVHTPKKENATIQVVLREKEGPERTIDVNDAGDGQVRIGVVGGAAGYRLRVRQRPDGSVVVQELRGPKTFAARADSMSKFFALNRDFSQQSLAPLFKQLGIALPAERIDPDIRAAIIAKLTVPAEKDREAWGKLLARLDADDFSTRESATTELAESFERFRPLILAAAAGDDISVEAKSRLLEVIKHKHGEAGQANDAWIARLGLTEDPLVLTSLLASADDRERSVLLAALRKISGEDFGDDAEAWGRWAAAQEKTDTSNAATVDPLKGTGTLSNVAAQTKKLVKLALDSGRLQLDCEHWKQPFGGKSIDELEKEIETEIRRRGFPDNWYRRNSYGSSGSKQPVDVLFAHIVEASGARMRSWGGGGTSCAMQAASDTFDAKMSVAGGDPFGKGDCDTSRFELRLSEKAAQPRSLDVVADGEGVRITITDDSSDYLLHLAQDADGPLLVQELRGLGTFSAKEESYEALKEKHAPFVRDALLPVLNHFGVMTPEGDASSPTEDEGKTEASPTDP